MREPSRVCMVDGCDRAHYCKALCRLHYQRLQRRGALGGAEPERQRKQRPAWMATRVSKKPETARLPREVVADYSYPDRHPEAPHGQRLAVFTCPVCEGPHLVAWRPFDLDPGWKAATCRIATASGGKVPQFYVLAPPLDRQHEAEPVELVLS